MEFPEEIKRIRQRSLLTQADFAEIVHYREQVGKRQSKAEFERYEEYKSLLS